MRTVIGNFEPKCSIHTYAWSMSRWESLSGCFRGDGRITKSGCHFLKVGKYIRYFLQAHDLTLRLASTWHKAHPTVLKLGNNLENSLEAEAFVRRRVKSPEIRKYEKIEQSFSHPTTLVTPTRHCSTEDCRLGLAQPEDKLEPKRHPI